MATETQSALSRYMTMAERYPRLDRPAEAALCERYLVDGDKQAKEQLVRAHLRYVISIAMKYRHYGLPLAELIAEGNFGIVHALSKFEPARGNRFVTYAAYWIRAYILDYVIRSWSMVGVGSGALRSKMFFKLRRERVRITNLVGEGEHADELLAERFEVSREQIQAMVRRLEARDMSLDMPMYEDGVTALVETLVSPHESIEVALTRDESAELARDVVKLAMGDLDERERFIAERRMMADAEEELSLAEIGRILGVSRERARQLEVRAKRKLKQRILEISAERGQALSTIEEVAA